MQMARNSVDQQEFPNLENIMAKFPCSCTGAGVHQDMDKQEKYDLPKALATAYEFNQFL
jgi:hypothetical protein